jgi:cytoskeletal protein RodZ
LDTLNTPIVVLAVIVLLVPLNSLLFFGYYLPKTNAAPASSPQTERTTGATISERTHPTTTVEETPPRKTSEETTAASPTATATATAATATASP